MECVLLDRRRPRSWLLTAVVEHRRGAVAARGSRLQLWGIPSNASGSALVGMRTKPGS